MLENIPGNFKNEYKKEEDKLKCRHCNLDEIMTQSHCLNCSAWSDLKTDLDFTNIDDLVLFFRRMLSEREKWITSLGPRMGRIARLLPLTSDSRGCS